VPQPEQTEAGAGEAAWGVGGGVIGGVDVAGCAGTGPGANVGVVGALSGAAAGVAPGIGATPSRSGVPHFAQAIHAASSMGARHFGHRPATNGSTAPQNGQRATSRAMNVPQAGQGCL
jgi:hypothetical protein